MKDTKQLIFIICTSMFLFLVLFSISIHNQKTECIASGGKWISGIVAGNYTAFCIPK